MNQRTTLLIFSYLTMAIAGIVGWHAIFFASDAPNWAMAAYGNTFAILSFLAFAEAKR